MMNKDLLATRKLLHAGSQGRGFISKTLSMIKRVKMHDPVMQLPIAFTQDLHSDILEVPMFTTPFA